MGDCTRISSWVAALAFAASIFITAPAFAQPRTLHLVNVEIGAVVPQQPAEGQPFRVWYRAFNTGLFKIAVSGYIAVTYNGKTLYRFFDQVPEQVSVGREVDGWLEFTAGSAGVSELELRFTSCAPVRGVSPTCGKSETVYARTSIPLVVVSGEWRTSGVSFITVGSPVSQDPPLKDVGGRLVVTHDPGCGTIGNNGTDAFYPVFPPGATYAGTDFGSDPTKTSGGLIGEAGSIGVEINYAVPGVPGISPPAYPYVRWKNTCFGALKGEPLVYWISFRFRMPPGMDPPANLNAVRVLPPGQ